MVLNLWEAINNGADKVKDWVITMGENQWFWLGIFFLGILIFVLTYNALSKNK